MKLHTSQHPLVPKPCHEDWDKFSPIERGHFCATCQTPVYDLSSMTQDEAETFLASRDEDETCISYSEKAGEVQYRRAPMVPLGSLMRRLPAAAGFSMALAACSPTTENNNQAPSTDKAEQTPQTKAPETKTPETKTPVAAEAGTEPQVPPEADPPVEEHVKGKWANPDQDPNKPPSTEPADAKPEPQKRGRVAKPK